MESEKYLRAKLEVLNANFRALLRVKTKPYTNMRYNKKKRLKTLNIKIKEIEVLLNVK